MCCNCVVQVLIKYNMSSSVAPASYVNSYTDCRRMTCCVLEDGINAIGLGPQGMGGKYSVMGVHIENTARHPSTIGVAVNVGCWSHRRGHIIFDKDLNYTITTHSGVTL